MQRLDGVVRRPNCSNLGVGALSGNPFALDRDFLAKELEFTSIHPNSMAAVADMGFVVETLQWSSLLMAHLSRLSEDLIIYSTAEFGFVRIAEAYSTGSSLIPQKKNPDSLELIRGNCGRVLGRVSSSSPDSCRRFAGLLYKLAIHSNLYDFLKALGVSLVATSAIVNRLSSVLYSHHDFNNEGKQSI